MTARTVTSRTARKFICKALPKAIKATIVVYVLYMLAEKFILELRRLRKARAVREAQQRKAS